jgi:DNA-binding NarL/FixJ family response regulator
MPRPVIRIVVSDEQQLVRRALALQLGSETDFEVVDETTSPRRAMDRSLEHHPDVLILAMDTPAVDELETIRKLRQALPGTEIVVLAGRHNEALQREAFESGARCYLMKTCSFEDLSTAVRHAARGEYYLSGSAGRDLVAEYVSPHAGPTGPGGRVTKREREIAVLISDGYSTKEAAAILNISVKTAETHRASLMRKLGARNVADVVKYCIRNQLVDV